MIQDRASPAHRSRIIAANNVIDAIFMVGAAGVGVLFAKWGLSVPQMFLVAEPLNVAVAVYIYTLVPEFVMRLLVWMLVHVLYRARARGVQNVPRKGAASSSATTSLHRRPRVSAAVKRPVRFVMDHRIFRTPVLGFVFRTAKAIPIAPPSARGRGADEARLRRSEARPRGRRRRSACSRRGR